MDERQKRFKQRLLQLQDLIASGLAFYAAWRNLHLHDPGAVEWSLERQNQLLGRWRGFFTPVGFAVQRMAMLDFAKVFDTDRRAASLPNLLNEAQGDPDLVPHARPGDLALISARLVGAEETLKIIKRLRNQRLAHLDSSPGELPSLMSQKIDALAEDIKWAFNRLSSAHDGSIYGWDFMLRDTQRQTTDVLGILSREIDRRQAEHDQAMVDIGLAHMQEIEATIGRRLSEEERHSALDSLGMTSDQLKRIQELTSALE